MTQYSIYCEDLTKVYQGDRRSTKIVAVDNLSLCVEPGAFYGFLGPNGAGKSTTIKMLTGLLRPTSGKVVVAGHDLSTDPLKLKSQIGVLPEDLNLYERLTAFEFLLFSGQMYGLPSPLTKERAENLLKVMALEDARNKMIVDFSMGMKKKIALAGAMIHEPRVLFLDEPFNGIDAISTRKIRDVLKQKTDGGTTVFFSSHVLDVVEKICSRVAIISKGRLVADGTMEELRALTRDSSLEDIFVRLVSSGAVDMDMVGNE
jgi:ABC-2 type transport system ATP-binding protein